LNDWFFVWAASFSVPAFSAPAFLSVALTALPTAPARPLAAPSEDYFHGGGLGARLFREGRQTEYAQQISKKKHMKPSGASRMFPACKDLAATRLAPANPSCVGVHLMCNRREREAAQKKNGRETTSGQT